MRTHSCHAVILLSAVLSAVCSFTVPSFAAEGIDWSLWRDLPVQNGGRRKPLDTLAWESMRTVANRGHLADPDSGQRLDPLAWCLTLLFDWQGWGRADLDQLQLMVDWRPLYFHLHQPDKWDQMPLLRVDFLELRAVLRLAKGQQHVTPAVLDQTRIDDPRTERSIPFSTWAGELLRREQAGEELTELERKGLELADRFWTYQDLRMGRSLELLPIPGDAERKWVSLAHLWITHFDDSSDPHGELRRIQQLWIQARESFQRQDAVTFNRTARQLVVQLRQVGMRDEGYPSPRLMGLEVAYNQYFPFRCAWVLMLVAAVGTLVHLGTGWTSLYRGAVAAYVAGLAVMISGFALRIAISGRPPVTNMYESVVYVGAGVAVLGFIFEWINRRGYVLAAAATVATVVLVLADNCPLILDPSVRPLEPVLRSNFWLITHVMTITLSYAALALALGIANITLGYYLAGSTNGAVISALSRFTYRSIQVGVWLLAAGIVLGGIWADYSWGRFWGWDPKEVWALVALLGYLAVLHARYAGWVGHRGLATLAVACFALVVMAWYGVNFVLGAGLHSYGFGGGGQSYVYAAIGLQMIYAMAALGRSLAAVEPQGSRSLA